MQQISAKEYKTRLDWVGELIHKELCKKLKFDHTTKWYVHNPESVRRMRRKNPLGFWNTNKSRNLGHYVDIVIVNKKIFLKRENLPKSRTTE